MLPAINDPNDSLIMLTKEDGHTRFPRNESEFLTSITEPTNYNIVTMLFLAKLSIFLAVVFSIMVKLKDDVFPRCYVFSPERLQELSQQALKENPGATSDETLRAVHVKLQEEYGDYINDYDDSMWVFNNAGNAMGTMLVLHASISEYLIFFGTAIGTEGHTGTHFADDYFTILYGEQTAATAFARVPERYLPGDQHHLPYGSNKQYRMPENAWALELAQGHIVSMLPFGFIEVITSTFDIWSFAKSAKISAINMGANLLKGKI